MFNALALAMFATAYGAGQGNLPIVPIERTTRLVEVGFYRVSYQIKGKEVVNLGMGWTGHFEPIAGVSYTPWSHQDGVPTLLIHCPWRRGGGTAWVDYRFKLPPNVKAKFTFGCAMWRKSEVQKGSDGVTFAVFVNGVERFRKHIKSSHWEWHEIDLSEFAGKAFTLRLEVNAGPKNDASWDYSLWGDPKIAIEGARAEQRIPKVLKETLDGLSNDHRLGVRPSVHYQHRNTMRRISDRKFEFTYDGEDCKLRYIVEVRNGIFPAHVEVRLDDLQPFFAYASDTLKVKRASPKSQMCEWNRSATANFRSHTRSVMTGATIVGAVQCGLKARRYFANFRPMRVGQSASISAHHLPRCAGAFSCRICLRREFTTCLCKLHSHRCSLISCVQMRHIFRVVR